jgi:hypothetical protein
VVFCILTFIASIATWIFITEQASQERPSALILTRKDAENRALAAARADRGFLQFLLSAAAALALGVPANYLFFLLSRLFAL